MVDLTGCRSLGTSMAKDDCFPVIRAFIGLKPARAQGPGCVDFPQSTSHCTTRNLLEAVSKGTIVLPQQAQKTNPKLKCLGKNLCRRADSANVASRSASKWCTHWRAASLAALHSASVTFKGWNLFAGSQFTAFLQRQSKARERERRPDGRHD